MTAQRRRIGVLGGSFDPPHCGHLAIALAAAARFDLHHVLLVPTARQPLKPDGACAFYTDRLGMVRALCAEPSAHSLLKASDLEAPRPDGSANYTIDSLRALHAEMPGSELFVVVGVDAFLDLQRWREPEALLREAKWIVVSRPGVSLDRVEDEVHLPAESRAQVFVLEDVAEDVSATEIRARLQSGQDCEGLLPAGVLSYIRAHGLYAGAATASKPLG